MNTITPLLKANNLRHNTKSKQQRRGDDRVPPAAARLENDNVGGGRGPPVGVPIGVRAKAPLVRGRARASAPLVV